MSGVTSCGLNVFKPAYVVLRGDTRADPVTRLVAVTVQSTRLYDSKLWSLVSLSNAGRLNTRVWLYSYCIDSSTLTLPLTIGPPNVKRGVHDSRPLNSPARRLGRGSRSFTVTCQASPARSVSTVVTAPADRPNSGANADSRTWTVRTASIGNSIASSPVTGSVPSALLNISAL